MSTKLVPCKFIKGSFLVGLYGVVGIYGDKKIFIGTNEDIFGKKTDIFCEDLCIGGATADIKGFKLVGNEIYLLVHNVKICVDIDEKSVDNTFNEITKCLRKEPFFDIQTLKKKRDSNAEINDISSSTYGSWKKRITQ